jgi:hypothetical protein
VLETNNQEQLIFKHAISTVVMAKGAHPAEGRLHERSGAGPSEARATATPSPPQATGEPVATPSGTEG